MPSFRWNLTGAVLLLFVLQLSALVAAQRPRTPSPWKTLNGSQPIVIAKGGFSGVFPDSSAQAYFAANQSTFPGLVQWCDVQMTKDGVGICLPNVNLGNCTDIKYANPPFIQTTAIIDGLRVTGWFPFDYTSTQLLSSVFLVQGIYSRTPIFDSLHYSILRVDDLGPQYLNLPSIWLNVQHELLYKQRNLSIASFLTSPSRSLAIDYISSPEVSFLKSIASTFKKSNTKIIFQFLEATLTEPSTRQTYASLLKNLTFVKTFASGILIPKAYICPVTPELYLQVSTSIVSDAHRLGLEVYASDFANDNIFAYNYSYDPIFEYLSFVDNKNNFTVDGVLSDFPGTASESIGCFSHIGNNSSGTGKTVVISHNGASGMFPDCTDLAYEQAINDGADFIDCAVQVTKDGVLVCLSSVDLIAITTVSNSLFGTYFTTFPEIQSSPGIFTFNLTWENIQSLKPTISTPFFNPYKLVRNPLFRNAGKFMTLADFLSFAKNKSSTGVLIIIENAPFLVERLNFDIIGSVIKTLNDSGYNSQSMPEVMIQSTNSSVLIDFKQQTNYKIVYRIDEVISDADSVALMDIKLFASSVIIGKQSIFPVNQAFVTHKTNVVKTLQSANLSVYVYLFQNEFIALPWDFYDPYVDIHNYVAGANVDGIITDFPATASAYKKNTCLSGKKKYNIPIIQPGGLLSILPNDSQPPALPPIPPLTEDEVREPPLPQPTPKIVSMPPSLPPLSPPPPNGQPHALPSVLASLAMLFVSLLVIQ